MKKTINKIKNHSYFLSNIVFFCRQNPLISTIYRNFHYIQSYFFYYFTMTKSVILSIRHTLHTQESLLRLQLCHFQEKEDHQERILFPVPCI